MSKPKNSPSQTIVETVGRYYAERLERFGPTPQGVDWNSAESQSLRFNRLLVLLQDNLDNVDKVDRTPVSLNDYGCGYGALVDYFRVGDRLIEYHGFDISDAMIRTAATLHADDARCFFTSDLSALRPADYALASGIFNVKLRHPVEEWREYALETLMTLNSLSTRGFAFNMLSTYSDPEKRRDDLFYMDPLKMFDFCKRQFSPRVALLHDYPLFEFTIIVRR